MNRSYAIPLFPAVVGVILALNALIAPFGNTGVDGTLGAILALIGSIAAAILIAVTVMRPLPHGWFVALNAAAILAALLTAVAAFFLMQTLLMAAMIFTLLALAVVLFMRRRRFS